MAEAIGALPRSPLGPHALPRTIYSAQCHPLGSRRHRIPMGPLGITHLHFATTVATSEQPVKQRGPSPCARRRFDDAGRGEEMGFQVEQRNWIEGKDSMP